MGVNWLAHVYVHHPFKIIITISLLSGTCLILPFVIRDFPNFSDPQLGYQTRGTPMANKLTTWFNLIEQTKEDGIFTTNPMEYLYRKNITTFSLNRNNTAQELDNKVYGKVLNSSKRRKLTRSIFNGTSQDHNWFQLRLFFVGNQKHKISEEDWDRLSAGKSGYFCGSPHPDYSHVVLESAYGHDLFTLQSLQAICRMQDVLTQNKLFKGLCVRRIKSKQCCRCWSLPNYVALLNDRESCRDITVNDVEKTKELLRNCSHYYHSAKLSYDCSQENEACHLPAHCSKHNAVFSIMNYLTSTSFLPPNKTEDIKLHQTIIFIPVACSSVMLDYYNEIVVATLNFDGISIVASEFGLKSLVFEQYLIRDSWLLSFGALFVFVTMCFYTRSIFLTIMTIIGILFSLGVSYFLYKFVFNLDYFPFMNLLTIVIVLGIGTDDAFVFCNIWKMQKESFGGPLVKVMSSTLDHAIVSMIITSFTTAVAFAASYISSITAIKCFSLFASITIMINCFMMIFWFPPCVIIWENKFRSMNSTSKCTRPIWKRFSRQFRRLSPSWIITLKTIFIDSVIRFRHTWFWTLSPVAVACGIVVFYYPKLQLPNTNEFQLLHNSHPFEQYEMHYSKMFWFSKSLREDQKMKLPLRFVWGVVPQDNGNYLEPLSYGTLQLDERFNMSHPDSQVWLLNFCRNIREHFFHGINLGLTLTNCFIETFKEWMKRKCEDDMENVNHSPCCETETFPFRSWVFEKCVVEAIAYLYKTPQAFRSHGFAGPKFSKENDPVIKALVIEFQSNYTFSLSYNHMEEFVNEVETWFINELETAPETMRGGFFISNTDFYDLQKVLSEGTVTAVIVSMTLSLIVLYLTTLNIITSTFAIMNITCNVVVTLAFLILLKWTLNIIESMSISCAIGLAVDFPLHYTVSYKFQSSNHQNRLSIARQALTNMLTPVTMSALTTGVVGALMLPSRVMAYIQIGTFLIIVVTISWIYSTVHLISMLALFGPIRNFGQCTYKRLFCKKTERRPNPLRRVPPKSDEHEMDLLTVKPSTTNIKPPSSSSNQSPSGVSVITVTTQPEEI
nr:protein dispatched homolog 1 isoform X1 [Onthophagus taurus]